MHVSEYAFAFNDAGRKRGLVSEMDVAQNETVEIGPGNLKLTFSTTSGQLTRIFNSKTGVRHLILDDLKFVCTSLGSAVVMISRNDLSHSNAM